MNKSFINYKGSIFLWKNYNCPLQVIWRSYFWG